MNQRLLHTPDGVRDIYSLECEKKNVLEQRLHQRLKTYGYHDIQTPSFEYFDVFSQEVGTIPSRELFKFFDREGDTLVLRPDFTPSIARSAAKYYMDETRPIRMCYMGNTFVNNSSYQGRLKESTQLGAELLGDASPEADAEMIAMVIELLLDAGLKEFQVSIGQIDFFKGFLLAAGLDEEQEFTLRELISNKNNFGIEEFLDDIRMPKTCREAFIRMPQLFGNAEVLKEARRLADNSRSIGAIERLEAVYHALKLYDLTDYISFDLGLVSKYKYYTGVIFQAYTYGTGEPIVKGGRYDNLLARFGKDFAATGFAVVIDQLMSALSRQKIAIPVEADGRLVLYDASSRDAAIHLAVSMRKDGRPVELVRKTAGETAEDYRDFAAENGHGKIYDLTAEGVKEADV
ncbi:ATP phosphoribosyltransferase regulatory subunit [Oscillospiraceae bacterium Marseille-Q3528]|nr:ATP phosphoribosyltransferase regulatory subunit [Oscillospiraceae bacterium Marseille-Q3528]WNV56636.1 ATP phosphoribosyltransferase regulatory subunit [Oscillospiraceae bacterium NTUH-002-81]